ncbi:hypothetical protein [Nostoc punctiforme]|uniref:hypothetical protein n=1 Tax=Nostoc punctiforme TaxID=272131 RepID=UPI0030EF0865
MISGSSRDLTHLRGAMKNTSLLPSNVHDVGNNYNKQSYLLPSNVHDVGNNYNKQSYLFYLPHLNVHNVVILILKD